jgi:hypothetical protein
MGKTKTGKTKTGKTKINVKSWLTPPAQSHPPVLPLC